MNWGAEDAAEDRPVRPSAAVELHATLQDEGPGDDQAAALPMMPAPAAPRAGGSPRLASLAAKAVVAVPRAAKIVARARKPMAEVPVARMVLPKPPVLRVAAVEAAVPDPFALPPVPPVPLPVIPMDAVILPEPVAAPVVALPAPAVEAVPTAEVKPDVTVARPSNDAPAATVVAEARTGDPSPASPPVVHGLPGSEAFPPAFDVIAAILLTPLRDGSTHP